LLLRIAMRLNAECGFIADEIGKWDGLGFAASHPSRKNKYAARLGYPTDF